MQVLQWLVKTATPESPKTVSKSGDSASIRPKVKRRDEGEKTKSKSIVVVIDRRRRHGKKVERSTKLSCDDMILLRFLQRKDVSKPFFYHTLNLKGLGSLFTGGRRPENTMRKRSESEVAGPGGNKVLPFADQSAQSSSRNDDDRPHDSDMKKCGKKAVFSRMKELLRWSATAKGKHSRKEPASETRRDDDEVTDESPKISIRWEMEGCYSKEDESAAGIGSWITTDSEFVVLEL